MKEDLIALWKVWVPATFVNFALSPMWFRIPFVATTSLLWTCILSSMRGAEKVTDTQGIDLVGNPGHEFRLMNKRPALDPQQQTIVVTAIGTDRTGIASELTKLVLDHQGNISESKMMRLGSQFCVMMLVTAAPDRMFDLRDRLSFRGLHSRLHDYEVMTHLLPTTEIADVVVEIDPKAMPSINCRFRVSGADHPGILHGVTDFISSRGMNIEDLHSSVHAGSKGNIFVVEGSFHGPQVTMDRFRTEFLDACQSVDAKSDALDIILLSPHE
jgi:glycine cleavage system regulatory protein